ncbi:MAG TPA: rhombosortase [Pirellulales bacterium]|jgi:rhomboid family GlyGly-CTERM serine protease|nr:rhombosortase [Pirellulales bacterium]
MRSQLAQLLSSRWTLLLTAAMLPANWSLFSQAPAFATQLTALLEYDREAVMHGELWRLVTGNLVHWSLEHFCLDVGAFLLLGILYEPSFRRSCVPFGRFLFVVALLIGATLFALAPGMKTYRGLSGVDSGVFATGLLIEAAAAKRDPRRWIFVGPALLIFTVKIGFEGWTGRLFFGTASLGDLGQPVPLAHAAGAIAAICYFVFSSKRTIRPHPSLPIAERGST